MVYVAAVTDPNPKAEACAICGRTILRGERVSQYINGDGETVGCASCARVAPRRRDGYRPRTPRR